jgi:hypothetical protein
MPAAGTILDMATQPVSTTGPSGNVLRAIGLKITSVAVFVAMSSFIKAAGQLPAGQIVFFRSGISPAAASACCRCRSPSSR